MTGTTTLVDATPGSYTITANDWKIFNFNDHAYFFQRGYEPLVYSNSLGAVTKMSSVSGASVTSAQYANEAIAAYGRVWCVGNATNDNTIYWSDLLIGISLVDLVALLMYLRRGLMALTRLSLLQHTMGC
jgi:hypothetical protein